MTIQIEGLCSRPATKSSCDDLLREGRDQAFWAHHGFFGPHDPFLDDEIEDLEANLLDAKGEPLIPRRR